MWVSTEPVRKPSQTCSSRRSGRGAPLQPMVGLSTSLTRNSPREWAAGPCTNTGRWDVQPSRASAHRPTALSEHCSLLQTTTNTRARGGERLLTNASCGWGPETQPLCHFLYNRALGRDQGDRGLLRLQWQPRRIAADSSINGSDGGVGAAPRDVSATSLSVDFWRLRREPARPTSCGGGRAAARRQSLLALGATNGTGRRFQCARPAQRPWQPRPARFDLYTEPRGPGGRTACLLPILPTAYQHGFS